MSIEENKTIVRQTLEGFWNAHDVAAADKFFAADLANHDPLAPNVTGLEALKAFAGTLFAAFPDFHVVIDDEVAEGDKVAKIWTLHGTQQGEFQGIPPTGKSVSMNGITVYRIANGKIVDLTWSYNMLGMMQQLGAIPVPA
jgi:steroid delta-isomerase-like uncharacterized protein